MHDWVELLILMDPEYFSHHG